MDLIITRSVYNGIIHHAKKEYPIEACGYLSGKDGIINQFYEMKNVDNSTEHFSFDPEEQFNVLKKTREEGLEIIANYHSHPASPARPSEEDIRLAFDPQIFYLIVSLAEAKPVINAYRINNNAVSKIKLTIND